MPSLVYECGGYKFDKSRVSITRAGSPRYWMSVPCDFYSSSAAPDNSIGRDGDFCLDVNSRKMYHKRGGRYILIAILPSVAEDGTVEGQITPEYITSLIQSYLDATSGAGIGHLLVHTIRDEVLSVGTEETTLFESVMPGGSLSYVGSTVEAFYAGKMVQHATATRRIRLYVNNVVVFDSGALKTRPIALPTWNLRATAIRCEGGKICHLFVAEIETDDAFNHQGDTEVTDVDFDADVPIKLTGQAGATGAANGDVSLRIGTVKVLHPITIP